MSNNINEQFRNYSRSADNNKAHVLEKLAGTFLEPGLVLEIGSGSGQHAVYCGNHLPHLVWQPTDQAGYLHDLKRNIDGLAPSNVNLPLALDVAQNNWPLSEVDYVYSANTLHILSEAQVTLLIQGVGRVLKNGGFLALYGPFKYGGGNLTGFWRSEPGLKLDDLTIQVSFDTGPFTAIGQRTAGLKVKK